MSRYSSANSLELSMPYLLLTLDSYIIDTLAMHGKAIQLVLEEAEQVTGSLD